MSATFTKSEAVLKIVSNDLRYVALAKSEVSAKPAEQSQPSTVRAQQAPPRRDYQREALGLLG